MNKKLRVFEAFAGYGSQSIALKNIGVPHEVVAISEIDPDAIVAYSIIRDFSISTNVDMDIDKIKQELINKNIGWDFKKNKSSIPRMSKDKLIKLYNASKFSNNLGDISILDVENIPEHDLFTYSFPCQDISIVGEMKGIEKGKTRSGLLYECEKIIEHCKPKYLLMENVKNLVGKKFKPQFDEWLEYLESLGYTNYWQVLNAKDYGIPQSRERVFVVSILGEHDPYEFPKPLKLDKNLKDMLEEKVDEKYYINNLSLNFDNIKEYDRNVRHDKVIVYRLVQDIKVRKNFIDVKNLKLLLKDSKSKSNLSIEDISKKINVKESTVKYWFENDNCFSIPNENIWLELKKILKINTDEYDKSIMEVETKPGNYDMINRVYDICGISPTLPTKEPKKIMDSDYRIRRLTPREYYKLMGVNELDIDKIQNSNISATQQYKMAGNSIVINVLEEIFKSLFL